jgi:hypothetical protein
VSKRQCKGTNKAGEPCGAAPLVGSDHCLAHDEEARGSTGFGGPQPGSGRPRIPRKTELAIAAIYERIAEPIQVLFDACEAVKDSGSPDWATRRAAAVDLLSWGIGRPPQSMALTGADGGPIQLAPAVMDEARLQLVYSALDEGQPIELPVAVNGNGRH